MAERTMKERMGKLRFSGPEESGGGGGGGGGDFLVTLSIVLSNNQITMHKTLHLSIKYRNFMACTLNFIFLPRRLKNVRRI